MTSKEAFKELKENAENLGCEWELYRINIIATDLALLEIIKKKPELVWWWFWYNSPRNKDDFNKIKEFLEK